MLYRLDTSAGPVTDLLGPVLISRYARARRNAQEHADATGMDVTITRISGAGRLSHALTVCPHAPLQCPERSHGCAPYDLHEPTGRASACDALCSTERELAFQHGHAPVCETHGRRA